MTASTNRAPIPGLILSLIMRNEARCIERCLASVAPHVERMVVLDTGSSDDSIALARLAGAEVHQHPWPDSFAEARNLALDLAGNYRYALVLDADEWLIDGQAALAAFIAAAPPAAAGGAALGVLRVDSSFEQDGQVRVAPSWLSRLLPASVRYCGRIHEQPVSSARRERLNVVIGHDGYRPGQIAGKRGRNRALLQAALAEAPGDAYLHYQLGKDAAVHEDWVEALAAFERARQLASSQTPWLHDLLIRSLIGYRRSKQFEVAWQLAEREAARWDDSPDFHFVVGDLALDCAVARPDLAVDTFFPLIEQHWQRALQIGDRPELDGSILGHGSHLAAHNLAVYYRLVGRPQEAARYQALAAPAAGPLPAQAPLSTA